MLAWMTARAMLAIIALGPVAGAAAELDIRVLNVADARGEMRGFLCTEALWLTMKCLPASLVPAHTGLVTLTFPDVPPGSYGVIVHHDINSDGEVNQNFLGIPSEGIGFSRDAPVRFGPPRWADAEFTVGADRVTLNIMLRFEPREVPLSR